jgi:hypothetical protein
MFRLTLKDKLVPLLDIILIGAPILIVMLVFTASNSGPRDIAFDSEKWRAESGRSPTCSAFFSTSIRRRMTSDLSRILLETTPRPHKQDVEQMLGQPNASKTDRLWSYWAGASTMDCLTFNIVFDESGTVVSASQSKP